MTRPVPLLSPQNMKTWTLVFFCCLYFVFCWGIYTVAVEPQYGAFRPPFIAADSGAYYEAADAITNGGKVGTENLVAFGGSSLGPATVALVFQNAFGVACFNCVLFLLVIWWSGFIPGVRREYFALLMAIEPQTLPTLMTLSKEMMAIAGLVAFSAYLYGGQARGRRRGPRLLLAAALVLSIMARWQQLLILSWYLAVDANWSPLRNRPKRAIVALLFILSAGWFTAVQILRLNLSGFIAEIQGGGLVTRLYAIQEKGGYFLIALPKIIMYLAGRWVTPGYFLSDYWAEDFGGSWQNQYIGLLSSLAMLGMVGTLIVRGRFRLDRPLIHLTLIYFICTAINPFIQPRYIYPAYALMALELSRKSASLEPVKPFRKIPSLPPSYQALQVRAANNTD